VKPMNPKAHKGRLPDDQRDVYGAWAVTVVNATRRALRSEGLMSDDEVAIIHEVAEALYARDPHARNVRKAAVSTAYPKG